jgi:hypothetical protein
VICNNPSKESYSNLEIKNFHRYDENEILYLYFHSEIER